METYTVQYMHNNTIYYVFSLYLYMHVYVCTHSISIKYENNKYQIQNGFLCDKNTGGCNSMVNILFSMFSG